MFGRRGCCLALLCVLSLSQGVFAQRRARLVLPTRRLLAPHGLERAWWSQATLDPTSDVVRHMVADETVVFVQSRAGLITAFEADSGRKLWAITVGRRNANSFPIAANDSVAVVITGIYMQAIEKHSGKKLWRVKLPSAASAPPALDDTRVYVGCLDGSVYAYDLARIRELFEEQRLPQWTGVALKWRFKGYKAVSGAPISLGYSMNFASEGGSLYSVTTDTRKLIFQFETDASISAPLAQSRGAFNEVTNRYKRYLYMASEDFKLYCIDSDNGRVRWDYNAGLPIRTAPHVIEDQVFVAPVRGGLHCVDRGADDLGETPQAKAQPANRPLLENRGGIPIWKRPEATEFLAATPSTVMASDRIGNVLLLSRENGAVRGVLPLRGFDVRISNGRTDRLFLATKRGLVVCIHEAGREFPIYHKFPDRRPILPEFTEPATLQPKQP